MSEKPRAGRRCENVQDKVSLSQSQEKARKLEPWVAPTADWKEEAEKSAGAL